MHHQFYSPIAKCGRGTLVPGSLLSFLLFGSYIAVLGSTCAPLRCFVLPISASDLIAIAKYKLAFMHNDEKEYNDLVDWHPFQIAG